MAQQLSRGATVFIGFMGAGKTTAARAADPGALDTDELIERRTGMTPAELFEDAGEAGFREIEEQTALEALGEADAGAIALGGGTVLSAKVREELRRHLVVWLEVDPETAWVRAGAEGGRPLATDRERFLALHRERAPLYAELADAVIMEPPREQSSEAAPDPLAPAALEILRALDEPGPDPRAIAALEALRALPPGTKMIWATGSGGEYPVFTGPGLLGPEGFAGEAPWPATGRGFVVTDENVREALPGELEALPSEGVFALPSGEENKTLARAGEALEAMAGAGWTRADHVIAFGGGVIGDLAGFCAHTYQRGIPVVQVPTTVVGQVDSAYGGKTGVDLPLAKNYVGAYHMPAAVVADTQLLTGLPRAEAAAGFVEALKTGLLAGGRLWESVLDCEPSAGAIAVDPHLVFDCARFKCRVVAEDERDGGRRQILNLGHTVGHAIEAEAGYGTYRHGEAVGLGLLAALRLSGAPELRSQVADLLERWGLPVAIDSARAPGLAPARILEAVGRDKKRTGDDVPFVLVDRPGEPRYGERVEPDALRAAVEELFAL